MEEITTTLLCLFQSVEQSDYLPCVSRSLCKTGWPGLDLKWVRLAPNRTNPGLFHIRFQYILALTQADIFIHPSFQTSTAPVFESFSTHNFQLVTNDSFYHLYLYKYENVCVCVCLSVCLFAFFSAIWKPIGISFGTKLHYASEMVLKQ